MLVTVYRHLVLSVCHQYLQHKTLVGTHLIICLLTSLFHRYFVVVLASKIPTPPGSKEPRRPSQHSIKTASATTATVNGISAGNASAGSGKALLLLAIL